MPGKDRSIKNKTTKHSCVFFVIVFINVYTFCVFVNTCSFSCCHFALLLAVLQILTLQLFAALSVTLFIAVFSLYLFCTTLCFYPLFFVVCFCRNFSCIALFAVVLSLFYCFQFLCNFTLQSPPPCLCSPFALLCCCFAFLE